MLGAKKSFHSLTFYVSKKNQSVERKLVSLDLSAISSSTVALKVPIDLFFLYCTIGEILSNSAQNLIPESFANTSLFGHSFCAFAILTVFECLIFKVVKFYKEETQNGLKMAENNIYIK